MSANLSYIDNIANQIKSKIDPSKLPRNGLNELFDSYALLALSVGEYVTNEDVHNAWSSWARSFEADNKSLVPFDELDPAIQEQDSIFAQAIISVAKTLDD